MEKKIVVSRRFRKNTLALFEYLRKKFSEKTAVDFLEKLENIGAKRIALFCVEEFAEACHRSIVANKLNEKFNYTINHL